MVLALTELQPQREGDGEMEGRLAEVTSERCARALWCGGAHSNEGKKLSMTREHKARKNEMGLER